MDHFQLNVIFKNYQQLTHIHILIFKLNRVIHIFLVLNLL